MFRTYATSSFRLPLDMLGMLGSMVRYFFYSSFSPGGAKKNYKGEEIRGLRTS